MGLATSFVPLHKVKPTASRWNFSASDLEAAAKLALQLEGIVNPIVVRREPSYGTYTILDGNFEYYAMAYAHQMDTRRCESIEAFVIEPRDEPSIQQQIALLRGRFLGLAGQSHSSTQITYQSARTSLLEIFNLADSTALLHQIKRIGLTGKNAEKVVEAIEQERQQYPFTSLKDIVLRIKGFTYEKMITLIEAQ